MPLGCALRRRRQHRSKMGPISLDVTTVRRIRYRRLPLLRRESRQRRSRTNVRPGYRLRYEMTAPLLFLKNSPGRRPLPRRSRTNVRPGYHLGYEMTAPLLFLKNSSGKHPPRPLRVTTGPRTLLPRPGRPRPGETRGNPKETSATSTKRTDKEC